MNRSTLLKLISSAFLVTAMTTVFALNSQLGQVESMPVNSQETYATVYQSTAQVETSTDRPGGGGNCQAGGDSCPKDK